MEECIEVYFYSECQDGFHLSDTFHTVLDTDISKKIPVPEFVKKI